MALKKEIKIDDLWNDKNLISIFCNFWILATNTNIDIKECSICLEFLSDKIENNKKLQCGHIFHNECINKWKNISNKCPCCRHIINKNNESNSYDHLTHTEFHRILLQEIDWNSTRIEQSRNRVFRTEQYQDTNLDININTIQNNNNSNNTFLIEQYLIDNSIKEESIMFLINLTACSRDIAIITLTHFTEFNCYIAGDYLLNNPYDETFGKPNFYVKNGKLTDSSNGDFLIDEHDILLVMDQTFSSKVKSIQALINCNCDLVNAIMKLTVI